MLSRGSFAHGPRESPNTGTVLHTAAVKRDWERSEHRFIQLTASGNLPE